MDPVTHILDAAVTSHNQGLAKVGLHGLALRVYPNQLELLPAAVNHILDAQVQLAAHDDGLRLPRQTVQEIERNAINLVVHIQALDVLAVVLHDDVDEVVDGGVFVTHQDFAVEDFVVAEDVVEHLLVEMFRGRLEGDFHAACFFGFEIDVAARRTTVSATSRSAGGGKSRNTRGFAIQSNADGFQFGFQQGPLLGAFRSIQHHEDQIARLGGGNDLTASALALGGTLDDAGEIEELDLSAAVLEDAGDGCEGRECVRGDF